MNRAVVAAVGVLSLVAPATAGAQDPACDPGTGLASVGASPGAERGAVRLEFEGREALPVGVDIFRVSDERRVRRDTLVARFSGRSSAVDWNGRDRRGRAVGDGYYYARYTMARGDQVVDVRRVALARSGGTWSRRPSYERRPSCDLVTAYRLQRPVFGGTRDAPLQLTFRLASDARVRFIVRRVGGQVVSRQDAVARSGRRTYVITLPAGELRRGDYRVTLEAVSGSDRVIASLTAHRL